MKSNLFIVLIASGVIYLVTSTLIYNIDYSIQDIEEQTKLYEQKIDELIIEERLHLSRDEAINTYKLDLNNNWYYLKDEDEQEEKE